MLEIQLSAHSPVAVFIYNRPYHMARTLRCLKACEAFEGRPVHVFCDGPKSDAQKDGVGAARAVARDMLGDTAVYHEAAANWGIARSIIGGVDALTREYGRVIVVEDDLEVGPGFLVYIDKALDTYAEVHSVIQVSGHMFDVPEFEQRDAAVLLPFTSTWGWATWRRAWDRFDETAAAAPRVLDDPAVRKAFNLDGIYDYAGMLEDQLAGRRDSWGIRFYLSTFDAGSCAVFPPRTLVRNTGFDGSGSHGRGLLRRYGSKADARGAWPDTARMTFPLAQLIDDDYAAVKRAIFRQNGGRLGQAVDLAKRLLKRK
jgi:hypothetical protein